MWQVRDDHHKDVTTDQFYWDMGKLYVFWPGQTTRTEYSSDRTRWHAVHPAAMRRLSAVQNFNQEVA